MNATDVACDDDDVLSQVKGMRPETLTPIVHSLSVLVSSNGYSRVGHVICTDVSHSYHGRRAQVVEGPICAYSG